MIELKLHEKNIANMYCLYILKHCFYVDFHLVSNLQPQTHHFKT